MSKRVRISVWKAGSKGASNLARALGIKVLKQQGSTWIAKSSDVIINWGNSRLVHNCTNILNPVGRLNVVQDKLKFFQHCFGKENAPRVPPWTTNPEIVEQTNVCWLARTVLNGHSGAGIKIIDNCVDIPHALLYTMYIPKKEEYRIHYVNGKQIDIQRKVRDPDSTPTNWSIRSHKNGFIYIRNNINPPLDVTTQASKAFIISNLDFGAVDVIWNEQQQKAYVLEINTAPGLEGETVTKYANAFKEWLGL